MSAIDSQPQVQMDATGRVTGVRIEDFCGRGLLELSFLGPAGVPSDYTVIAGPNGCGKTTLLRTIHLEVLVNPQRPLRVLYIDLRRVFRLEIYSFALGLCEDVEGLARLSLFWTQAGASGVWYAAPGSRKGVQLHRDGSYPDLWAASLSSGEALLFFLGAMLSERPAPGVLLLDGVDGCLHPEWAGRLIPAIRTLCPKAQVVVASNADDLWDNAYSFQRFSLVPDHDPRSVAWRAAHAFGGDRYGS